MIMFNHFRTPPIGVAVKFNLLFVCINGYFISQILAERREDVELADHETSLWETCFANSALTKVQMRDLLGAGTVGTNSGKGTVWCTAGKAAPQTVFLLAKGKASVTNGRGEHLATIGPGEFVGELGWLADTKEHRVSTVSVVFTEPCTFVEWPARDLTSHLNNSRKKDVKLGFEAMLALQISHKLERMNDASALEVAYCNLVLGVLYGREEVGLDHRAFVRAWAEQRGLLPKGAAVQVQSSPGKHERGPGNEDETGAKATAVSIPARFEATHARALAIAGWTQGEYEAGSRRSSP
eukprot:CAMPEP_0171695306 /NCGR_PEP_ID=MMETSP0991-20121206/7690_1 /TAXON_ID=483369 /ORGANISM="non described non described, Strain CCMP2098" /LENGTH=295 /DNA_ID=CAMNT_0012283969 /DNA_START=455 /DNA_END=1342 /DNA_ORIENTATION=-